MLISRMKKFIAGCRSYRSVVILSFLIALAGCGLTPQNAVDDSVEDDAGDATQVWRASEVPFQLCETDTFVVSELSFTREGDVLTGTLSLVSGQTGLMASGPFEGTVSGEAVTGYSGIIRRCRGNIRR